MRGTAVRYIHDLQSALSNMILTLPKSKKRFIHTGECFRFNNVTPQKFNGFIKHLWQNYEFAELIMLSLP